MALFSVNPATGRRVAVYRTLTRAELERSLIRADTAQRAWRRLTARQRSTFIRSLGAALRTRAPALAALATDEMGKPVAQGLAEVEKCAGVCDFYAKQGPDLLADTRPAGASGNARVTREPLGVILAIMPWNFPYWQVFRAAIPALLTGNGVLLKHAPNVAGCALAIEKVFAHAGFPPGVFQSLLIDVAPVPALIADPRVRGVTLTGSTRAGMQVAALAGAALKPVVLELGGSDPLVVFEDADLDRAAETAATARLLNSGQSCICAKRIIVQRTVLADFTRRFVERVAARRMGDPTLDTTDVGPMARADLRDNLDAQVRRTVVQGAKVVLPGGPQGGHGFFYAPVVLGGVTPGMTAFDEETFGPAAAIVTARDETEAIKLANATSYGLGASIWTDSKTRAKRVIPQLESGCVFVNDFVRSSPELPFGGIKRSGFGRELGTWGLESFANIKTVVGG
jgi:succinate-semialdehyde dehydrogenase/glutarate-semialdehyde dehydrogenase